MAEVIWAEPALNDLDAIADYIALDDPEAAGQLVQKIFEHVDHLESHPRLGSNHKNSKAGVIAKSSSRRVASSTEKIRDESWLCDQSACSDPNFLPIESKVNSAPANKRTQLQIR